MNVYIHIYVVAPAPLGPPGPLWCGGCIEMRSYNGITDELYRSYKGLRKELQTELLKNYTGIMEVSNGFIKGITEVVEEL